MTQKHLSSHDNKLHNFAIHQKNKARLSNAPGTNLQGVNKVTIDPDMRLQMIALSAYFRAEKCGSFPGSDLENWLVSEQEVDRHLSSFSS